MREEGLLWRDPEIGRPGRPLLNHLTEKGIKLLHPDWPTLSIGQKLRLVHRSNYADLGLDERSPVGRIQTDKITSIVSRRFTPGSTQYYAEVAREVNRQLAKLTR